MTHCTLRRFLGFAACAALSTTILFGQGQAPKQPAPTPSPSPSPGTGTGPGSQPGRTPNIPGQQPSQFPSDRQQIPEFQRPIYLAGRVMLDDGNPPGESVVIERVCNGVVRPEGYTDSKGKFSFELGRNNHMMADASVGSESDIFGSQRNSMPGFGGGRQINERDLMGCEIRANLPGYRSDIITLSGRRVMDNPEVGTIILHRMANVEGFTISATTAMAPKEAKKEYEKALNSIKKDKWKDAKPRLEKAVELYPKFASAWFELGRSNEALQDLEGAKKAYSEALNADTKFVKPYMSLAGILVREQKWQEVADTTDRLVRLNPYDYPGAYFYNSVANLNLHQLDVAEKSAREALKIDKDHRIPKANHVLGIILANKQDYSAAAEYMRTYLQLVPNGNDKEFVQKQLAEIDKAVAAKASQGTAAQQ